MSNQEQSMDRKPIENRMEDCGGGRHVGWWMENRGLDHSSLLIEIQPRTVLICCCEGEHAKRRINFVVGREKGEAIVRAMMKALGIREKAAGDS